ncbi:hypothetical protein [Limnohabitans sp.]|jgi:hypothetical protein|uniref:hypothetical protein n=1 Tax=Limnohabitans sp. TaxID=1907725 RepID=UPI00391A82CB
MKNLRVLGLIGLLCTALCAPGVWAQSLKPAPSSTSAAKRNTAQDTSGTIVVTNAVRSAQTSLAEQHEQQLQAIRQALLDLTLERPTRVLASAWIDSEGALQEVAHFHSEAHVRGVRVLSYLQDGPEQKAAISAEVLPWGMRPGHAANGSCQAPPRPWRLPLLVHTRTEGVFNGWQLTASQMLLESAAQSWSQQLVRSQRWQAQASPRHEPNTYLRALSGHGEDVGGWAVELSLTPLADADWLERARLQKSPWSPALWRWALTLNMGLRSSLEGPIQPVVQARHVLTFSSEAGGTVGPQALRPVLEEVHRMVASWAQSLDERSQCEPVRFAVQRTPQQGMVLYAGQGSGLREGDRLLIMNPSHVPSRMLEAGAAQHLALAEVVRVGRLQTELQLLAGPALQTRGPWVAVPL